LLLRVTTRFVLVNFAISYEQGNQINTVKIYLPFSNFMKSSQTKSHADTVSDFKFVM